MNASADTAAVPSAAAPPAIHHCTNCGTALTGPYCSECGQRHHEHPVHSLRHFVREATEDLTHADSRLWITLRALLFRPGFLTTEFLAGRRARYLPPVRLYLVVSLLFFILAQLAASLAPAPPVHVVDNAKRFSMTLGAAGAAAPTAPQAAGQTKIAEQRMCQQTGAAGAQVSAWLGRRLEHSCFAAMASGGIERFESALQRNFERAMFLLLPLLAAAMVPLYRKPRRYYVEHLLFFLHNHSCLFVLLGVDTLIQMISTSGAVRGAAGSILWIYVPVYFYLSMRRVYAQSRWRTLGKMTALAGAYMLIGGTIMLATITYSFLML